MAKERTSVRMQAQIKKMAEEGYSLRAISRVLRLSRKTIRKYLDTTPRETNPLPAWVDGVDCDLPPLWWTVELGG